MRLVLLSLMLCSACAAPRVITKTERVYITSKCEAENKEIDRLSAIIQAHRDEQQKKMDARIIHITIPTSEPARKEEESVRTVTVQNGDTLGTIAADYGVTIFEIMEVNRQFNFNRLDGYVDKRRWGMDWDPDYIKAGDSLVIP